MTNRRTNLPALVAAALFALLLPAAAFAQQGPWGNNDRDHHHDDDDDDARRGGHQPGRLSDYDRRALRDVARRINDRSRDLQRNLDRLLDNSRYDDTSREDHINDDMSNFRRAAERFKDRAGEGNNLNRSAGEARQLLDTAAHVGTYLRRLRLDGRTQSDWSQIRANLRTVADFYGFRLSDLNGSNDGYYGRGRNDRGRRDDDDYYQRERERQERGRRRNTGVQWPRNWPRPF